MMMPTCGADCAAIADQAMLSGISRLSSQDSSSFSSSLRFFRRCRCSWSIAPVLGQPGDHRVEVAVLAAEFVQLAQTVNRGRSAWPVHSTA